MARRPRIGRGGGGGASWGFSSSGMERQPNARPTRLIRPRARAGRGLDAALPGRDRLLGDATDGADRALEADRARRRHVQPAGQLAGRDDVEDGERQRQARRVAADVARVDPHVDGQVLDVPPAGLDHHTEEGGVGVVGPGAEHHLDRARVVIDLLVDRHDVEPHHLARDTGPDLGHEIVGGADRRAVDGHDHVVGGQDPLGWPFDARHADTGGLVRVDAEVPERHRHRRRLRDLHEFEVERPVLAGAAVAQDLVLAE